MEAVAAGADGPRIPLPEAHRASVGRRCRASRGRRRTRCGDQGRSRSAKGRAWYRASRTQGIDRQASGPEEGQEVKLNRRKPVVSKLDRTWKQQRRGRNGTEDAPVRISTRLQQAVEVTLVCRPRLRRLAARRREAPARVERQAQERGHQLNRH